jgi:polysaccharide export outer membrane protein
MDRARDGRRWVGRLLGTLVLMAAAGCQTTTHKEDQVAKSNLPIELNKTSMPPYVVEPPDILVIDVLEALPGRPIEGERLVRPDGTISLDFYGSVYVNGLTLDEIKEKIVIHLRNYINDDVLGLVGENQQTGKKFEIPPAESDRVFVDVAAYNSKVYYVQGDVNAPGRLPIVGNETVLDAINNVGGLLPTASTVKIKLVRPAPPGACCAQTLPINLPAIVQAGDVTTNYQLMPGDRIYVYRDPIVRTAIFIDRLAAPFNAVIQSMLIYSFGARSVKSIDVPINGGAAAANRNTNRGPVFMQPPLSPAR